MLRYRKNRESELFTMVIVETRQEPEIQEFNAAKMIKEIYYIYYTASLSGHCLTMFH